MICRKWSMPLRFVETMFAPTAMPSVAPSASPSIAPPPTASPTDGPKDKSFGETLTDNGGTGIATAAVGSVIIMVALQCGREFLVDLFIRCCKVRLLSHHRWKLGFDLFLIPSVLSSSLLHVAVLHKVPALGGRRL